MVGVIAIEVGIGAITEAVAVPWIPFCAAVIVTGLLVGATPVASPLTVIWTVVGSDDVHVTVPVMSCVVRSLKVPVAVYCC